MAIHPETRAITHNYYQYIMFESSDSLAGFHPEGIILGGKLQEVGGALYTFLYNCPKFGGGGGGGGSFSPPPPLPPLDENVFGIMRQTGGMSSMLLGKKEEENTFIQACSLSYLLESCGHV